MANIAGRVASAIVASASKAAEASNKQLRSSAYGDLFHIPVLAVPHAQAGEGSRFAAMATPVLAGTGVVLGSYPTVYSDTAKIAVCITNNEAAGGKSLYLDFLRARVITADTNGTSIAVRAEVDSTNRYSSGGTALTPANVLPGASAPASVATMRVGDVTCAAAGTYRTHVGHTLVKKRSAPCLTVDDTYIFTFGGSAGLTQTAVAGQLITTLTTNVVPFGPAVIPPAGSFMLQIVIAAGDTAPASLCWEAFWAER